MGRTELEEGPLCNEGQIETAVLSMCTHGQILPLCKACQMSLPFITRGLILELLFEILWEGSFTNSRREYKLDSLTALVVYSEVPNRRADRNKRAG